MIKEEDIEISIKLVIVGDGGVGKSSLIQRYCKGVFTKEYKKTIGVDFLEKELEYNNENIRLQIWDTDGQEEFDAITKSYYRGAQACLLAYSITDIKSFNSIASWKRKVENECGPIITFLIQNKMDIYDQALILTEQGEQLAQELGLKFFTTSAKNNDNIDFVFRQIAETYVNSLEVNKGDMVYQGKVPNMLSYYRSNMEERRLEIVREASDPNTIRLEPSRRRTKPKKDIFKKLSTC